MTKPKNPVIISLQQQRKEIKKMEKYKEVKFEAGKSYAEKTFVGMESVAYAETGSEYFKGPKVKILEVKGNNVKYECCGYIGHAKIHSGKNWYDSFKAYRSAPKDRDEQDDTGYIIYANEVI